MSIFSKKGLFITLTVIVASAAVYFVALSSAHISTEERLFRVEEGSSISAISKKLKEENYIKSRFLFQLSYFVFGHNKPIIPGAYKMVGDMSSREVVSVLEDTPWARNVFLPPNLNKEKIAVIIADALGWDMLDRQFFPHTLAGMQWQRYHDVIQDVFEREYEWNRTKKESFLTLSALYYSDEYDFFKHAYVSGTYEIPVESSRAQVAGILIDQFAKLHVKDEISGITHALDELAMNNIATMIEEEMELMPDIVAMPALDVTLTKKNGKNLLAFTTSYWNKGRGVLEFIADPKSKGVTGDLERKVYQRIYSLDGDYRERFAGSFMWHQPHLHYHFTDFAVYSFEPINVEGDSFKEGLHQKSTFCIRDSEPVDLAHPGAKKGASYSICGKERQGISPGWADSYYYTYVDQTFDVTKAPRGTYSLKISVNPKDRFEEITKDNNVSEVIVFLDVENGKVDVLEEK